MTKLLRWAADLFRQNPTPFTFLIFVTIVLVAVLISAPLTENNQSVAVWGLVLVLLAAAATVVVSLRFGSSQPLTAREVLIVNKHIALETGQIPACGSHYIGGPIRVAQQPLLALYNRIVATGT